MGMEWLLKIRRIGLSLLSMAWVFRQVRKPSGWLGKRIVRAMNLSHAAMTDWGLQQITVPAPAAMAFFIWRKAYSR